MVIKISDEKTTFETELENLIDAFYALMPTANRISQFIALAEGNDYEVMREAYPELLGDKNTSDKFFKIFGYKIEEGKIRTTYSRELSVLNSTINSFIDSFKE